MADLPFSWSVDLEPSRIRTLYGNGENPVLPYEPQSTVIKISKYHLGTVSGTQWILQFEHTKIYDQSFYGQEEKAILLLERDDSSGNVEIEGTVSLYDLSSHKRLTKTNFSNDLPDGNRTLPIHLNLTMCELSHVVFENFKLCVQGNVSISSLEITSDDVEDSSEGTSDSSEIHIIKNNPLTQLSYDLASLLKDGSYSDVTIKCDSAEIPAHKNIMSARSPVFAVMFQSNMAEGLGNELVITDVKLSILQKMLTFVYSSQVIDLDVEMACDLMYVACKYQISGLIDICTQYLKFNLIPDNALKLLCVGDMYDHDLKQYIMDYISSCFSKFEETNEWKALKKEKKSLFIEVLEHTLKHRFSKKCHYGDDSSDES